jgi:hypothetical protein
LVNTSPNCGGEGINPKEVNRMSDPYQYFDAMVANRSNTVSAEQALEGSATLSLETQRDLAETDVLTYVEDNFADFLRRLRHVGAQDQELLLGYFVLGKTQTTLAMLHGDNQSRCSAAIKLAMQKLGRYIMTGKPPAPLRVKRIMPNSIKPGPLHYKDAAALGQFRIAVEDSGFEHVFTGHATR